MTVHTAHPGRQTSTTTVGVALAGALLAVGVGYGVAELALDEAPVPVAPGFGADDLPYDVDRYAGFDPNGFAGTDREERSFQHRR